MERIVFTVMFMGITQLVHEDREVKLTDSNNPEQVLKDILGSLPKRITKTWEAIVWHWDNQRYEVQRIWLQETNFNFWQSVEITEEVV